MEQILVFFQNRLLLKVGPTFQVLLILHIIRRVAFLEQLSIFDLYQLIFYVPTEKIWKRKTLYFLKILLQVNFLNYIKKILFLTKSWTHSVMKISLNNNNLLIQHEFIIMAMKAIKIRAKGAYTKLHKSRVYSLQAKLWANNALCLLVMAFVAGLNFDLLFAVCIHLYIICG